MAWYAVVCGEHGHNKDRIGNQFATYKIKKQAVVWAHKYYRDAQLTLRSATLSLVESSYRRNQNQPKPKQPITPYMLFLVYRQLASWQSHVGHLAWGCFVLQYFYLGRAGEFWLTSATTTSLQDLADGNEYGGDRPTKRSATGLDSQAPFDHRVQAEDCILRDSSGKLVSCEEEDRVHTVTVRFRHAKADQAGRSNSITLGRSGHPLLCPVKGGIIALQSRKRWKSHYKTGALSGEIRGDQILPLIKSAAQSVGLDPADFALHSIRIGYATALFEAGYDELAIRLAGRWSSDVVGLYTRISGKVLLTSPRDVIACALA
jgi:hypothetical protein